LEGKNQLYFLEKIYIIIGRENFQPLAAKGEKEKP